MEDLPTIKLKPSRIGFGVQLLAVVLAACSVALSGIPLSIQAMLVVMLALLAVYFYWQFSSQDLLEISCYQQQWRLWHHNAGSDAETFVEMVGEQLVCPWLLVLRFYEPDKQNLIVITLWPDSALADELRQLRVFVRFCVC